MALIVQNLYSRQGDILNNVYARIEDVTVRRADYSDGYKYIADISVRFYIQSIDNKLYSIQYLSTSIPIMIQYEGNIVGWAYTMLKAEHETFRDAVDA